MKVRRFESATDSRFLTFSCNHRLPLLSSDASKDIVVDYLELCRDRLGFQLFAWVVMPEHLHLLLLPNRSVADVRRIMSAFKTRVSRILLEQMRVASSPYVNRLKDPRGEHHFWLPGGGYDRNIHSHNEFEEKARYIEQNPVRRGLAANPEEYRWSSAGSERLRPDPW